MNIILTWVFPSADGEGSVICRLFIDVISESRGEAMRKKSQEEDPMLDNL